jgi:hypothetical protein
MQAACPSGGDIPGDVHYHIGKQHSSPKSFNSWAVIDFVADKLWNIVGKQLSSPKYFNSWAVIDFVADKLWNIIGKQLSLPK